MKNSTGSWLLHPQTVVKTLRTAMLILTFAVALIIHAIIFGDSARLSQYLSFIVFFYIVASLGILNVHLRSRGRLESVIVQDGILVIPRVLFKSYRVPVSKIKSIEKYATSKGVVALQIGRINNSSIFVERRNFASTGEFEEFLQFMDRWQCEIEARATKGTLRVESIRRWGQGSGVIGVVASTLCVTYLISSSPGFEQLSNQALVVGGLVKESTYGEIYRIASSFFLHLNPFHLGFNIFGIAILGQNIDIIFGRVRLLILMFASAMIGSLLSLAFSPFETVIGASGGILGLVGAYSIVCAKHQQQIPGSVSVSRRRILVMLTLQILFDLMTKGIDIFSHLGGFLFGVTYTYYILRRHTPADAADFSRVELFCATILVLGYAIGLVYYFSLYAALS